MKKLDIKEYLFKKIGDEVFTNDGDEVYGVKILGFYECEKELAKTGSSYTYIKYEKISNHRTGFGRFDSFHKTEEECSSKWKNNYDNHVDPLNMYH